MAAQWMADLELTDMEEDDLWEMIERHRCKIVQKLSPERLTPYLRQTKVLDAMDEEEILHCTKFSTRAMRLGHLLDILRTRGKNGAIAFLDSLILANQGMYTLITGKEPRMDPNSFSKLIDNGQLSVLLMNALSNVQEELMQEKQVKKTLAHHLRKMREKQQKLEEEGECVHSLEYENQRLRRELDAQSQMLSKLKDEQYELSMRYSHALQEKDSVQGRNSDLQEQIFAVKEDLHRVRAELQVVQSRSHQSVWEEELRALRKENCKLKERREGAGEPQLAELDIKVHPDGHTPSSQDVLAQLCAAEKNRAAEEVLELMWQKEKESLMQESRHLQSNYDILKKKMEAFHRQVSELQKERDQAYRARDMVQAEISCSLAEKDSLRKQVMDLTERNSELRHHIQSLEEQLQSLAMGKELAQFKHQRLVRMDAICPSEDGDKGSSCSMSESLQELSFHGSSDLGESLSSYSFHDEYLPGLSQSCSRDLPDILQDERAESDLGLQICSHLEIDDRTCQLSLSSPVRRRRARKITSRVTMIAFQGDDLLKQIGIIGGNKTGIFVHHLTPGSAADEMSLMPGYQIMAVDFDVINPAYKVDLGGMTSEDAHSTLNRVRGFCCLSVQCNMEDYRKLLQDLEGGRVTSGDSFYVRVNQSVPSRVDGGLKVSCGEIVHVTDTMYNQRCQWFARRVNPYTLKDGDSGIIPNYRQAQQQLITSIQSITWQNSMPRNPQKEVRIVSTERCSSHLLWTAQDCGICCCEDPTASFPTGRGCLTLMPYTLVTHYKTSVLRPVLLIPSLLRRILSEKLCANKDYMKCDTECLTDAEYAARNQRGDIIGGKEGEGTRCWYTRQNVESVAQQNAHCLLELGLSCLSALIRVGIYPIILHIPLTEKSTKKLRKTRQWWGKCEELLLECAQREEAELDALPCLYRTVDPDSWTDPESLLCRVKSAVTDEQKRVVWLENQPR